MIRKTALLAGIAGAMLTAVPAMAQDATSPAPQTPPSSAMPQTAPSPQTPSAGPAAPSGTLQLQPGADVKGSDGSVLGKLEGVQNNAAGEQELTVRGADGQLRGVPLGGLRQEGAGVVVAWTTAEFTAAPAIEGDAPASATPAPPTTPSTSPTPADPAAPSTDPTTTDDEDTATPPPAEPQA